MGAAVAGRLNVADPLALPSKRELRGVLAMGAEALRRETAARDAAAQAAAPSNDPRLERHVKHFPDKCLQGRLWAPAHAAAERVLLMVRIGAASLGSKLLGLPAREVCPACCARNPQAHCSLSQWCRIETDAAHPPCALLPLRVGADGVAEPADVAAQTEARRLRGALQAALAALLAHGPDAVARLTVPALRPATTLAVLSAEDLEWILLFPPQTVEVDAPGRGELRAVQLACRLLVGHVIRHRAARK
jgi:hypothetical protein